MLDIKRVRNEFDKVKAGLDKRGGDYDLDGLLALDQRRRKILGEVEKLKNRQNTVSKEIPKLKKAGQDIKTIMEEMKELSQKIKDINSDLRVVEEELKDRLLSIPNVPNQDVPLGDSDKDNIEIRRWGEVPSFDFEFKAHWDVGTDLNILDFERAGKVTGARFTFYKGLGARLERALISFMLDLHSEKHGYTEVLPPYMVNRASMTGTGQLPKFEEDAFKTTNDYFLIPTAEVPVTNMYRDDILDGEILPIKHVAYSACFRAEAGSAGRDTRGLIRQHQFNKV